MRCKNCGLPLSPERTLTICPRCNIALHAPQSVPQRQFQPVGWGDMGEPAEQSAWRQAVAPVASPQAWQQDFYNPPPLQPNPSRPLLPQNQAMLNAPGPTAWPGEMRTGPGARQSPPWSRQPLRLPQGKTNARTLFLLAGLCFLVGILILGFVGVLGLSGSGQTAPGKAQTNPAQASMGHTPKVVDTPQTTNTDASPTASASPSGSNTSYPGQQYIDSAHMVAGGPQGSPGQQSTTNFKVGSSMYVVFQLHPPSQGGAVCSYWYLGGTEVTSYASHVSGNSHTSYTYAIYGTPGQAYVELYWASDKTCADKSLAQRVNFTVTA